ncbi:tRNA (adenosine(37)-N6)-threonylcarbamoyltransferase complex ATPase subunit type 1 TsaE [Urechidicola sp. KH5]
MKLTYALHSISDIAKEVIKQSTSKILVFHGKMGAGKTTLIKAIAKELGVSDVANSPTFSLVNEYVAGDGTTINHFDFYRIDNEEEAYDMGFEDYLYSDGWCFIEWGEKVENLLPLDVVNLQITIEDNNKRTIQIN